MNRTTRWASLAGLLLMTTWAVAGGPAQGTPAQGTRAAPFDCGQTQQIGTAGDDYPNLAACNNGKPALQRSAVDDGNRQCTNLCTALGCSAKTAPAQLTATASCKADANQKGFGVATTGPFDCKCTKP